MTQTQWLPGMIALAIGLACGLAFLLLRKSPSRRFPVPDERQGDLELRAQLIVDQLKELNADRHHLEADEFEREKNRLETEAAAALRARDEYARSTAPHSEANSPASPAPAAPAGWFAQHPQLKGAFWGGGVVLFGVVLGLLLSKEQKPRQEGMGATGKQPTAAESADAQDDPALKEAMANYEAHPDSVEAMSHLSHELINRQGFQEATRLTERALGLDPFHLESRIHRSVLTAIEGDRDKGQKALEHLANAYPGAYEARLYLGLLALQRGDHRAALQILERYSAEAPRAEQPPHLGQAISALRQQVGSAGGVGSR